MKITRRHLRQIIKEEINRSLSEHRRDKTVRPGSELAYARSGYPGERRDLRSRKGRQRQFHKASRQQSRSDIESQMVDVEMGDIDTSTIATLIPQEDRADWERMSGHVAIADPTTLPRENYSERDAYLGKLAWDIAYDDVEMDEADVERLSQLSDWFGDTLITAYLQRTADDQRDEYAMGY